MLGKWRPLLLVALLLAGCAAPAATRDDAGAPPVASAADVDLHEVQVNVSMPAGNTSATILLHVTKDMWVPSPMDLAPAGDPTWWGVCVYIIPNGMSDASMLGVVVERIEDRRIVPFAASSNAWKPREFRNPVDPYCYRGATVEERTNPEVGLYAKAPFDTDIVVFVGRIAPDADAPFHVVLGIGQTRCKMHGDFSNFDTWCPPDASVPAEPIQRGAVARAQFATDTSACNPCGGFEVNDDRSAIGPAALGTLKLTREQGLPSALAFTHAFVKPTTAPGIPAPGAGAEGPTDLEIVGTYNDGAASVRCRGEQAPAVGLSGWSTEPSDTEVKVGVQGMDDIYAYSWEYGLDPAELGWEVPTSAYAFASIASPAVPGPMNGRCLE